MANVFHTKDLWDKLEVHGESYEPISPNHVPRLNELRQHLNAEAKEYGVQLGYELDTNLSGGVYAKLHIYLLPAVREV